jgi:prepilin-type N-terminal cleavage/methylation domain-containing protein
MDPRSGLTSSGGRINVQVNNAGPTAGNMRFQGADGAGLNFVGRLRAIHIYLKALLQSGQLTLCCGKLTIGPSKQNVQDTANGATTRGKAGFTLLELIVAATILSILTLMALPLARLTIQREKEKRLRHALWEMRDAIDRYKDAGRSWSISDKS